MLITKKVKTEKKNYEYFHKRKIKRTRDRAL